MDPHMGKIPFQKEINQITFSFKTQNDNHIIIAQLQKVTYEGSFLQSPLIQFDIVKNILNSKQFQMTQRSHQVIKIIIAGIVHIQLKNKQQIVIKSLENQILLLKNKLNSQQEKIIKLQQQLNVVKQIKIQNQKEKQNKWIYFEQPKSIYSFGYNTKDEVNISFDTVIPKSINASEIKLLLFLRSGNEQNTTFWTRTRVLNDNQQTIHWTYAHRYPQSAISYNSQTVIFSIHKTRQIRVKSNHIQPSNCHAMQYFIVAYR